jgi:hypothetical protein
MTNRQSEVPTGWLKMTQNWLQLSSRHQLKNTQQTETQHERLLQTVHEKRRNSWAIADRWNTEI